MLMLASRFHVENNFRYKWDIETESCSAFTALGTCFKDPDGEQTNLSKPHGYERASRPQRGSMGAAMMGLHAGMSAQLK